MILSNVVACARNLFLDSVSESKICGCIWKAIEGVMGYVLLLDIAANSLSHIRVCLVFVLGFR